MLLFRDNFFDQPLIHPPNPAYRRKPLLSRKYLQVAGGLMYFFDGGGKYFVKIPYYHW